MAPRKALVYIRECFAPTLGVVARQDNNPVHWQAEDTPGKVTVYLHQGGTLMERLQVYHNPG
ncbi:MAG: hypothetical protein ACRERD_19305 [Candidatus Binatia bacterium]